MDLIAAKMHQILSEASPVPNDDRTSSPAVIETKLPLWWILASVTAIVFSMGGVFVRLESVTVSLTKIETKLDTQDRRMGQFAENLGEIRSVNNVQQMQIDRASADLNEISRYNRAKIN